MSSYLLNNLIKQITLVSVVVAQPDQTEMMNQLQSLSSQVKKNTITLNTMEKRLSQLKEIEVVVSKNAIVQELRINNDHLIKQFVKIINKQAILEERLNASFMLLDMLIKQDQDRPSNVTLQ